MLVSETDFLSVGDPTVMWGVVRIGLLVVLAIVEGVLAVRGGVVAFVGIVVALVGAVALGIARAVVLGVGVGGGLGVKKVHYLTTISVDSITVRTRP